MQPNGAGSEYALDADLVVAASGRSGRVPAWLEELGYALPPEDRLQIDLMYASRRLRLQASALGGDKAILVGPRPGRLRGLGLIAQEGNHWLLTLFGYGAADRPPTDENAYLEFAATVAPPDVLAAIRDAEPLDEIVTHAFPANQRRRYEQLKRFPDGLLVVGDAISSFNPIYGQGMSVAALEAMALRQCLARGEQRIAHRFFRAGAKVVDHAWEMAIGADLALPEIEGRRPLSVRVANAYTERLLRVAERDPVVAAAFNDVCDMLAPPQHVLRPNVAWRVLRGNLRGGRSAGEPATAAPTAL